MLALFRNGWLRIRFGGLPSLLISCFFASANFAQTSVPVNEDLVSVKTWKSGTRNLDPREIDVRISGDSQYSQYEWDLFTARKDTAFRLRLLFGKPLHKRAAAESYELFVKRWFGMAL
jgi:hypothetical protein